MISLQRATTYKDAIMYCPPHIDNCLNFVISTRSDDNFSEDKIDCSAHPIKPSEYIVVEGSKFAVYHFDWNLLHKKECLLHFLGVFKKREVAQLVHDHAENFSNLRSPKECRVFLQSLISKNTN